MKETPVLEPLHIKGDCRIADLSEADRNRLTSVEGYLNASNSANLSLPALESCRKLDARWTTNLNIPALTSCDYLYTENATNLTLPALTRVRGCLDARYTTGLSLPSLESVDGYLDAVNSTGLIIPAAIVREHRIQQECLDTGIEPLSHRTASELKAEK